MTEHVVPGEHQQEVLDVTALYSRIVDLTKVALGAVASCSCCQDRPSADLRERFCAIRMKVGDDFRSAKPLLYMS